MAVTGYFINIDLQYLEILLGFEPLHGPYTSTYLSKVLQDVLQQHYLETCVFAITTDNILNNITLIESLQQAMLEQTIIIQVPCLAYIIQLSLNKLLGYLKANPINNMIETQ
jgi:hypothetical protein